MPLAPFAPHELARRLREQADELESATTADEVADIEEYIAVEWCIEAMRTAAAMVNGEKVGLV